MATAGPPSHQHPLGSLSSTPKLFTVSLGMLLMERNRQDRRDMWNVVAPSGRATRTRHLFECVAVSL
jgi:hypothetical protein